MKTGWYRTPEIRWTSGVPFGVGVIIMLIRTLTSPSGNAAWWWSLVFLVLFLVLLVRVMRMGVQINLERFRTRNLFRSHDVAIAEVDHCELSGWWGGMGQVVLRDGSRLWLTGIQSRNFVTDRSPDRWSAPIIERLNELVANAQSMD
jgi:hypothetical protein